MDERFCVDSFIADGRLNAGLIDLIGFVKALKSAIEIAGISKVDESSSTKDYNFFFFLSRLCFFWLVLEMKYFLLNLLT